MMRRRGPRALLPLAALPLATALVLPSASASPASPAATTTVTTTAARWTETWVSHDSGTQRRKAFLLLPTISADGRSVTFLSSVPLSAGETSWPDRYARAYVVSAGATSATRVAVSAAGELGDHPDFSGGSPSADASTVVFSSLADNLVAGDTNRKTDVFLRNLTTGRVTLVSRSARGGPGNGVSDQGQVSADGRMVLFASTATNLTIETPSFSPDWYLFDAVTGHTTHLPFSSGAPRLSADGGFVTGVQPPASTGLDLRVGPYVYDVATGTYVNAGVLTSGKELAGSQSSISADGTVVAFIARNDRSKLYVRNLTTSRTVAVPLPVDSRVYDATLSGDGTRLAMVIGTQTNRLEAVVRVTDLRGRILFESRRAVDATYGGVSLDGTGTCVAFSSRKPELAQDVNGHLDIYTACQS